VTVSSGVCHARRAEESQIYQSVRRHLVGSADAGLTEKVALAQIDPVIEQIDQLALVLDLLNDRAEPVAVQPSLMPDFRTRALSDS